MLLVVMLLLTEMTAVRLCGHALVSARTAMVVCRLHHWVSTLSVLLMGRVVVSSHDLQRLVRCKVLRCFLQKLCQLNRWTEKVGCG